MAHGSACAHHVHSLDDVASHLRVCACVWVCVCACVCVPGWRSQPPACVCVCACVCVPEWRSQPPARAAL